MLLEQTNALGDAMYMMQHQVKLATWKMRGFIVDYDLN